jgi:mRNA interferase MazF
MEITRGDIVVAVLPGDYGKGRPALVVQSDAFNATHASIVVCPITSHLVEAPLFRIALAPSKETGLEAKSQVMIDKMMAIRRERIARAIGRVDPPRMREVDRALQRWLAVE